MALSPSTIVTARLTLDPLAAADADAMFAVLDDERMHEFTGGSPLTLEELQSRYERLAVGQSADASELWFNWIVRTAVDATPVGVMQATVAADGSSADVAWEVGVPWQGRGIASEERAPSSRGSSRTTFRSSAPSSIPTTLLRSRSLHMPGSRPRTRSTTVRSSGSGRWSAPTSCLTVDGFVPLVADGVAGLAERPHLEDDDR